jgi:hypothetical protein
MVAHLDAVDGAGAPGAATEAKTAAGRAPLSFLSFRSHADGFFAMTRDADAARQTMDSRLAAVQPGLTDRVAAVLAQVRGEGVEVSPAAARWHRAVRETRPKLVDLFRTGDLAVTPDPRPGSGPTIGDLERSAFHRKLRAAPELRRFLHDDPAFLAIRLLTSLLYLSLHHAGLPLLDRYFLCHATSRACEIQYGTDGVALLARLAKN